jgi:hypothetical protein
MIEEKVGSEVGDEVLDYYRTGDAGTPMGTSIPPSVIIPSGLGRSTMTSPSNHKLLLQVRIGLTLGNIPG